MAKRLAPKGPVKTRIAQKQKRRIVACGRGRVIQNSKVLPSVVKLTGVKNPRVLYLGTPGYESQTDYDLQASNYEKKGYVVDWVKVTDKATCPSAAQLRAKIGRCNIVIVSGGNTLFACNRYRQLGIDKMLRQAMARGCVLGGGSAGANVWFDAGHSDSQDPTTLRTPNKSLTKKQKAAWSYIRVSGLGFVSGLCCPHHDMTQSNGVPRASDFDKMLKKHRGETGVCIDDQAALFIDGDKFRVLATDGKSSVRRKKVMHGANIVESVFPPSSKMRPLSELIG